MEILDGIVVRRLPMPLPATHWSALRRSAVTGTRSLFSLRSAVAAFRPDVLHVQCFGPNGVYAHALSRITGLPLVVTLHGETLMDDTDIFDVSRVLRSSLRAALRTRGGSHRLFRLHPGRRRETVRAGAGPGAGDPQRRRPLRGRCPAERCPLRTAVPGRSPPGGGPDGPYILALGRVVEKKGFDLLLAAYAALDEAGRTADLVIGGEGEALDGLRQTASALGIADRVHFVGRLSRQEVADAMAGATLFVMPSRLEPFGIVILEAWRAGAPVVATNRGGPPEFVRDGDDGVLVDPFDTTAFAGVLESLLLDPERRRRIGEAGHLRVRAFGWADIAEQYREVYSSIVEPRGADDDPAAGRSADGRRPP